MVGWLEEVALGQHQHGPMHGAVSKTTSDHVQSPAVLYE